ncbi:MAG: RdgB/HAM1 family non-canonical purine NTP pyrophosphatase [Chthoniobacterales bacterium]
MRHLLVATRNRHKSGEFFEMLGRDFEVHDLSDQPLVPSIEETGSTFEENAILKAVEIARNFPGLVIADDSGLEVDALNGAPGVFSARYAGAKATDQANVAKLLRELGARPGQPPFTARFRCVLALAKGDALLATFEGTVNGTIIDAPRGSNGFGYDPVFQPNGWNKTFAECSSAEKNQISHRAAAIRLLREALTR